MAVTQYQIFCRYLNETINHTLTNKTTVSWVSAEELNALTKFYEKNKTEYETIKQKLIAGDIKVSQMTVQQQNIYTKGQQYEQTQDAIDKGKMVVELCILEPADSLDSDTTGSKRKQQLTRDLELYQHIIDETIATNPKYDMVFMYDGIAYAEADKADYNPPTGHNAQIPYVYYERMKRIKVDPWFLFSTHASLNAAMAKAKELINILGKDAVKIGKVVPLDQYIEIV